MPPHRFSPYARPTLLLITAEPHVSSLIADIPLAGPFRVLETPPPDMKDGNEEGETRHRLEEQMKAEGEAERKQGGPKAYAAAGGGVVAAAANENEGIKMVKLAKGGARAKQRRAVVDPPTKLSAGYNQAAFNALPLLERVVHTQAFVRDLTIIAREADAAVMSGASNVGRLAMLLAGKEAVVGPLDEAEKSLGGRMCVPPFSSSSRLHTDFLYLLSLAVGLSTLTGTLPPIRQPSTPRLRTSKTWSTLLSFRKSSTTRRSRWQRRSVGRRRRRSRGWSRECRFEVSMLWDLSQFRLFLVFLP